MLPTDCKDIFAFPAPGRVRIDVLPRIFNDIPFRNSCPRESTLISPIDNGIIYYELLPEE